MSKNTASIRPTRSLGEIHFDVVIEENHEDNLEITEHPVEQGAEVNDHAYKKAMSVTLYAGISNAGQTDHRAVEFYEKILELQAKRKPFDIITGKRQYENMLIEGLTETTDLNTENALLLTIHCREVNIVETQTTGVPPRSRHKNGAKTGDVSDKGQKQAERRKSGLLGAIGGPGHTKE